MKPFKLVFFLLALCSFSSGARPKYFDVAQPTIHVITYFDTDVTVFSGTGSHHKVDSTITPLWNGHYWDRLANDSGKDVIYQKTLAQNYNICNDSIVRVVYYFNSKTNKTRIGKFKIYLVNDATHYETYDAAFAMKDTMVDQWGRQCIYLTFKRKYTVNNTFTCSTVSSILIETLANSGNDTIWVAEVSSFVNANTTAKIIFTIDDEFLSWMQLAQHTMDSLGFCASYFLNVGLFGSFNKMTGAQFDSLYAVDCIEPLNHGNLHDTPTTVSTDSFKNNFMTEYNYFKTKHWKGGSLYALPYGRSNHAVDSTIRSLPIDFVRTTTGNSEGEVGPFFNYASVRDVTALGVAASLAAVESGINDVIASKGTAIILAHQICTACALDANTWRQDTTITLLKFIKGKVDSGKVQVIQLGKYMSYQGVANPSQEGIGAGAIRIGM